MIIFTPEKIAERRELLKDKVHYGEVSQVDYLAALEEIERLQDEVADRQGVVDAGKVIVAQQKAEIEAQAKEIDRLEDELEKMKIRCLLKLDIDSPIQKLSITSAREALKGGGE